MSDLKIKQAEGKVPFYLIPLRFLIGVARVFFYGSRKYAIGNWFRASDTEEIANRYVGGFLRHLSHAQREDGTYTLESIAALDDESGLPHIDHAICGLIMLRGLAVKHSAMKVDPGIGNDPNAPKISTTSELTKALIEKRVADGAFDVAEFDEHAKTRVVDRCSGCTKPRTECFDPYCTVSSVPAARNIGGDL